MNWDPEENQKTKEEKRGETISKIREWMETDPRVAEWMEAHLLCLRVTFSTMTAGDAEDALRRIPIYLRGLEHGKASKASEGAGQSGPQKHFHSHTRTSARKGNPAGAQPKSR